MNEHDVISRLSSLPDHYPALHIDLDNVIASARLQRKRRWTIAGAVLATAGVIAGLIVVTNQVERDAPAPVTTLGTWTVNSPDIKDADAYAIAAISQADVWIVGAQHLRPDMTGLAMHWDGAQWKQFDFPKRYRLSDVSAVASDDVWAVGEVEEGDSYITRKPVALHWDGHRWREVPVPVKEGGSGLEAVVAVAADDVWAVGNSTVRDGHPYIVHWNGREWQKVPTPAVPGAQGMILRSISAAGANDVWVAGVSDASPGEQPLALHWDSRAWSVVPVTSGGGDLSEILALASDEVWAVGRGKTYRFDGSQWQTIPVPEQANGRFSTLAPDGAGGILFGGQQLGCRDPSCRRTPERVLTARWNGTEWALIKPPVDAVGSIQDMSATPGGEHIWVVGSVAGATPNVDDRALAVASISFSR